MNCEKFETFMDDYLDLSLEQSDREVLEAHLKECSSCRRQFGFLQSLLSQSASLRRSLMPNRDLWPAIAAEIGIAGHLKGASIRPTLQSKRRWDPRNLRLGWRMAAAAGLGILVLLAATHLMTRAPAPKAPAAPESGRAGQEEKSPEAQKSSGGVPGAPQQPVAPVSRETEPSSQLPAQHETEARGIAGRKTQSMPTNPAGAVSQARPLLGRHSEYAVGVLPPGCVQQDVPIGDSTVAVGGSAVYIMRQVAIGETPKQIDLARWKAGQLTTLAVLPSSSIDIYAGLGIGSSPDDELYVAFAHHTKPYTQPASEIAKVDFENRGQTSSMIWTSSTLIPRSFAVSRQGYVYVVGATVSDERACDKNPSGTVMNLLHIIDPAGNGVASVLPTLVTKFGSILGLMGKAVFSVRPNGNFVLSFDQAAVALSSYRNLVARDVKEFSPQGFIVQTHTFPDLPEDSFIGSAVFDPEENLIVQVVRGVLTPNGRAFRWLGSYLIKESNNTSEQIRLFYFSSQAELLIGVLSDGTLVMKCQGPSPGQSFLRFRTQ